MELRRGSWVKTAPERWGEGSELGPEGSESQRKVVSQGVVCPLRAPKQKTPVWRSFWKGAEWEPGDQ